jgi:hypothetical protein
MSKYVAPSLRKEKTEEEQESEAVQILRDMPEEHFPSLSGFKPADNMPVLERAAQWESKHIQARIKHRTEEYTEGLRKRREEEEKRESYLAFAHIPKKEAPVPVTMELLLEETVPEVNPDEWITVQPKKRKSRAEKIFREEDYEPLDIFEELED